jgi:UDP-2,3-diacylglucosamine pyrophosphatase LpxH
MAVNGTKVYYITGNHDEIMRRYSNLSFDNFHLRDDLILQKDGKKFWFFHGDVFDTSIVEARWLAKIGGKSYDALVRLNRFVNFIFKAIGKQKIAFSKLIKMRVKEAVKFISDFEKKAIEIAHKQGYDYVICGHIHTPQFRTEGAVTYLNSGDWVENLTALEYNHGIWQIYHYDELDYTLVNPKLKVPNLDTELEEDEKRLVNRLPVLTTQFFLNNKQVLD